MSAVQSELFSVYTRYAENRKFKREAMKRYLNSLIARLQPREILSFQLLHLSCSLACDMFYVYTFGAFVTE